MIRVSSTSPGRLVKPFLIPKVATAGVGGSARNRWRNVQQQWANSREYVKMQRVRGGRLLSRLFSAAMHVVFFCCCGGVDNLHDG